MVFVMVTGERLILGTRKYVIYGLIFICITAPVTVTMHFLPPYLQYWQIPCYIVSYSVLSTTISIFNNMFRSLFRAATHLNNCFKVRKQMKFYVRVNFTAFCVPLVCNPCCFLHIPWEIILFNFAFSHHNLLITDYKWRIFANSLSKSNRYRVYQKVWRQESNSG
jgi:hypothetical protein